MTATIRKSTESLNRITPHPNNFTKREFEVISKPQMTSNFICTACLRVLRQQSRHTGRVYPLNINVQFRPSIPRPSIRSFSIPPFLLSPQTAQRPPSAPSKPTRLVNDSTAPTVEVEQQSDSPSAVDKLAAEVRKHASATTETYIAYGVCETLANECARQADYTMPQALEEGASIPRTKNGEHIGVGKGWWYEGNFLPFSISDLPPQHLTQYFLNRARPNPHLQHMGASHLPAHVRTNSTNTMFPRNERSNLAPAPTRPLFPPRRRPHGSHARNPTALRPQQVSQGPIPTMAGPAGRLRRGRGEEKRRRAGGGRVAQYLQC